MTHELSENEVKNIVKQLMECLAHMHGKFICHRDIKLENIMYDERTQRICIIDFGFAIDCKTKLRNYCGTPSYMAPELILKKADYSG